MAKVKNYPGYGPHYFGFKCPGCKNKHILPTAQSNTPGFWGFNGNVDKPTFVPSILMREAGWVWDGVKKPEVVCHTYVTDGVIEFLSDCTHELAGKKVELPEC